MDELPMSIVIISIFVSLLLILFTVAEVMAINSILKEKRKHKKEFDHLFHD